MKTKLLILDVDGTLTDGSITYGDVVELKTFNAKDGLILKALPKLGIEVIFLTGRKSEAVARRAAELGAEAVQCVDDKLTVLKSILTGRGIAPEQCAYIGDDLNDYAAMSICGFKACPNDAVAEIRGICDYVSQKKGGHGAVREICEVMLKRDNVYQRLLRLNSAHPASFAYYASHYSSAQTD